MKSFLVLFLLSISNILGANADLVIFSFDRPLQLYALLESTQKYITGIGTTTIIYRTSNQAYEEAYETVKSTFDWATFVKQGVNYKEDFKPLTLHALEEAPNDYIIFLVDDIVITDFINLIECIDALEETNAYGFYVRLGKNIIWAYNINKTLDLPPLEKVNEDMYSWQFTAYQHSWGYPNNLDATLYRKKNILSIFKKLSFTSPNTLEEKWHKMRNVVVKRLLLCYDSSKIVNLPLNRVQNDAKNVHMNLFTSQELLEMFQSNLKMNIEPLYKINNNSVHMPYEPVFVKRKITV